MSEIQNNDSLGRGETQSVLAGLFTPKGLALELGVTERTIARWHQYRIGPPRVRIGRKVYYRKDSVIAWVRACENSEPRAHRASGLQIRKSFPSRVTFQKGYPLLAFRISQRRQLKRIGLLPDGVDRRPSARNVRLSAAACVPVDGRRSAKTCRRRPDGSHRCDGDREGARP
jgi:hypothetical protein